MDSALSLAALALTSALLPHYHHKFRGLVKSKGEEAPFFFEAWLPFILENAKPGKMLLSKKDTVFIASFFVEFRTQVRRVLTLIDTFLLL